MAKKITIECKAKDYNKRHCYIVNDNGQKDDHDWKESTLCNPMAESEYINPKRTGYKSLVKRTRDCKDCFLILGALKMRTPGKYEIVSGTPDGNLKVEGSNRVLH